MRPADVGEGEGVVGEGFGEVFGQGGCFVPEEKGGLRVAVEEEDAEGWGVGGGCGCGGGGRS